MPRIIRIVYIDVIYSCAFYFPKIRRDRWSDGWSAANEIACRTSIAACTPSHSNDTKKGKSSPNWAIHCVYRPNWGRQTTLVSPIDCADTHSMPTNKHCRANSAPISAIPHQHLTSILPAQSAYRHQLVHDRKRGAFNIRRVVRRPSTVHRQLRVDHLATH